MMNVDEDIRPVEGNETYEDNVNFLPLFSSQIEENSISTSDNSSNLNLENSVRLEECDDLQTNSEFEVEKIPAWIRYLPKTNFSKSHRSKGETSSKTVEKSHRLLVKAKIVIILEIDACLYVYMESTYIICMSNYNY
jgi:hypothetical protein